ncbi:MAG: hypothetical protein E7677_00505 [Ruminococcaceae bacterium]|nr:hypothetical protein [Oscillospiraceae bacterium]
MTLIETGKRQGTHKTVIKRRYAFAFMSLFVIILFFKNASAASLWVQNGLYLCGTRLIPALFPFMVLSSIAIESGALRALCKLPSRLFRRIFKIGEDATGAVIIGWLCGFPVGARSLCELYASEHISFSEYKRAVCITSTPSPAFLIGAVGKETFGSPLVGVVLYVLSILISALIGAVIALWDKSEPTPQSAPQNKKSMGFAGVFTHAVTSAAAGMVSVCAFVVFFCAFLGVVESTLSLFELSDTATALIFSFFELTSGVARIGEMGAEWSLALCGIAVGWSGLSVHFQTVSMCSDAPFEIKPYVLAHLIKAALMGGACLLLSGILT